MNQKKKKLKKMIMTLIINGNEKNVINIIKKMYIDVKFVILLITKLMKK